jgi:polyhydroxyalkanoate synthesis regulator phasin
MSVHHLVNELRQRLLASQDDADSHGDPILAEAISRLLVQQSMIRELNRRITELETQQVPRVDP